jgi:hypothetical protein
MNFNGMTPIFKILSLIFCLLSLFTIHEVLSKHIDNTFDSVFYSFVINLIFLPTFGFMASGFPLEKLLPNSYYEDIQPERIIKLFHILRVDIFKRIVTFIPTKRISKTSFLEDIEREKQKSIKSEIAHLVPCFVVFLISLALLSSSS